MSRKLLLVEGRDDGAVAIALWNARGFPRSFEVEVEDEIEGIGGEIAGKDAVLKSLSVYFKNRQVYPVVGVLLDADESLSATWDAVAGRLQGAGYLIPSDLPTAGLVLDHPSGDGPRIGVWLMPDNSLPGMLEDFMRALIPGDDTLAPEVESTPGNRGQEVAALCFPTSSQGFHPYMAGVAKEAGQADGVVYYQGGFGSYSSSG